MMQEEILNVTGVEEVTRVEFLPLTGQEPFLEQRFFTDAYVTEDYLYRLE